MKEANSGTVDTQLENSEPCKCTHMKFSQTPGLFPLGKQCPAAKTLGWSFPLRGSYSPISSSKIVQQLQYLVNKSQNTLKKIQLLFPVYRPIIQQKPFNTSKTQMQTVLKLPKKAHKLHLSGLTACPKKGTLDTNRKSQFLPYILISCFPQPISLLCIGK